MNIKFKYEPVPLEQANKYVYYAYDSNKYLESEVSEKESLAKLYIEVIPEGQKLIGIEICDEKLKKCLIDVAKKTISNFIE